MRLGRIVIHLEPSGQERPAVQMGSLFHGWLVSRVDSTFADELHRPGLNPFSQYIERKGEKAVWHLAALNDKAYHYVLLPLLENPPAAVELSAKNVAFPVTGVEAGPGFASYQELADLHYLELPPANRLVFLTVSPVAFRSAGRYQVFPSEFHILQSLINRWNVFADTFSLEDESVLKALVEGSYITRYKLESRRFPLEGVSIPSFVGRWEMSLKGPEAMRRLAAMLGAYAEYAGIGIKTSLGMGGIRVQFPNYAAVHSR